MKKVNILGFVILSAIAGMYACSSYESTGTPEQLVQKDPSKSTAIEAWGTITRVESSQELTRAGLEMVEVEIQKSNRNLGFKYIVRPSPIGFFKIGEKVKMVSLLVRVNNISTNIEMCIMKE
jgi:hypothetical protein